MVVNFKVSSFPPPINYPCTTASHVVHYMHVQSFQLPFYSQIIIGSESANPHFQDRDALTQTISINNCCFSLVRKIFQLYGDSRSLPLMAANLHPYLALVAFADYFHNWNKLSWYIYVLLPIQHTNSVTIPSNTYILGDCTTSPPSPFFLYFSTNPLSTYRFPLYSQGH